MVDGDMPRQCTVIMRPLFPPEGKVSEGRMRGVIRSTACVAYHGPTAGRD
jgi:hypothetical protein